VPASRAEALKVAILGTRGIPANYGGFETCADEVGRGLAARGHAVTAYCRRGNAPGDPAEYGGVRLRYTGHIERKALGTLTHTLTATADALRRDFDVLLYFNAANAVPAMLAKLSRSAPIVLNVDGLEWKRRKWGPLGRTYYRVAEWLSTKIADRVVSDSAAIQAYYQSHWKTPSTFVPYGAHIEGPERPEILKEYGLEPDSYFLTASRLEPENNADITVRAFEQVATEKRLVIAGGTNYRSDFVRRLRSTADRRVVFLGPVYAPGHVRELHCGAFAYIHGNEVGGTNPALLKAMGYGNCVLALDVPYNAEVVVDAALLYRKDPADLAAKMRLVLTDRTLVERLRHSARDRVRSAYRWDQVIEGYERILQRAAAGGYRGGPPSDSAVKLPEA
jgi:glycosyltransferase involved in cell wall biosynthesis